MCRLLSIQRAQVSRWVQHGRKTVETGIWKLPVEEGVIAVDALGVDGDLQIDQVNHGGADKAVYVYSQDNLDWWSAEIGQTIVPGQLGENFTVSGLRDEDVYIGDLYRVGDCVFQVTQPRVPCFKLGLRMGDPAFVRRFHASGRTGFYWRVITPGQVRVGDGVERIGRGEGDISVAMAMLAVTPGPEKAGMRQKLLANPALSAAWREDFQGS